MTLSFAGFGFIGSFALWGYKKWSVVIFSINFLNILLTQALNLKTLNSTTLNRVALPILLSGGVLLLVYFSRHRLNGVYLKWLPILLFAGFTLLNQISLGYILGIW